MKLSEAPSASKLVTRTLLAHGGAFRAAYQFLDEGHKERIFIVANAAPASDQKIILFSPTTQIEKREAHHKSRASLVLVPLHPSMWDGVTEPCVLDCEAPVKRKVEDFLKHCEEHKYKPLTSVPEAIMQKVVAAVGESRTLSAAEKRLVLGPRSKDP